LAVCQAQQSVPVPGASKPLQFENLPPRLYKSGGNYVPENSSISKPEPPARGTGIIAAGLLLAALALVVLYTSRRAFLSPVALVVVAAIGVAALLLQVRLRPNLASGGAPSARSPFWFNALGVVFAAAAVVGDMLHLNEVFMLVVALAGVVSFAISGVIVLNALRKRRA
jgi:hypothetical protein